MTFKGKTALITGSTSGIGLGCARALAAEGANIVLNGFGDATDIEALRAGIEKEFGVSATYSPADMSKPDEIVAMVADASKNFGAVDILINNAGTGSNETIMEAPDEKWQYYWDLHVMAAVRLARGVVPFMRQRGGGVLLHNASICAKQPLGYEPIYNVTKAALMMFSKCLSNELVGDNIRVNCINPGLVLTPDWIKTARQLTENSATSWEAYLDNIAKTNAPIGRFGTPEELADFFVFLCSPRSSYCVGSTYYVDGGWLNVFS